MTARRGPKTKNVLQLIVAPVGATEGLIAFEFPYLGMPPQRYAQDIHLGANVLCCFISRKEDCALGIDGNKLKEVIEDIFKRFDDHMKNAIIGPDQKRILKHLPDGSIPDDDEEQPRRLRLLT